MYTKEKEAQDINNKYKDNRYKALTNKSDNESTCEDYKIIPDESADSVSEKDKKIINNIRNKKINSMNRV